MRRLVLALCLAGCGLPSTQTAAPAPLVDTAGGNDAADRDCTVVLRQMLRDGSSWDFVAEVEISDAAAAQGLAPSLLYTSGADPSWYAATGSEVPDGATPGFVRYEITVATDGTGLSAIPYLPMAGGGRLFDHNRDTADLASYVLDASDDYAIWSAPAVCAAPTDARGATIAFAADWTQSVAGVLVPGGSLTIDYDRARLAGACAGAGADVTAHVAFSPDGEQYAASVAGGPATFTVPTDGARQVAIWFEATDATGCTAWDSAYGANYTFAIEAPPAWMGLATDLLTRDTSSHCGGADAAQGFAFDTWARSQAAITNLCFQVYQPGLTDTDGADLWQQLDARLHWRLVAGAASTPWTTTPIGLDARVGNNAQYALSWRDLDPFRPYHCPELAPEATPDGQYVQIGIEYYVDVNGGELRPEPGAAYAGTFVDYPSNPWRSSNCASI